MHPVLARFLNVETAWQALARADEAQELSDDERDFVEAAMEAPEALKRLKWARGQTRVPEEAQHALLALATRAALRALRRDNDLGRHVDDARAVLEGAGADPEESEAYLASLLAEEAFGYEDAPDAFDRAFFLETLSTLPALAALTPETVKRLQGRFLESLGANNSPTRNALSALLDAAWIDGPEPINPEHLRQAIEELRGAVDRAQVIAALRFLQAEGLMGELRVARLVLELPLGRHAQHRDV